MQVKIFQSSGEIPFKVTFLEPHFAWFCTTLNYPPGAQLFAFVKTFQMLVFFKVTDNAWFSAALNHSI